MAVLPVKVGLTLLNQMWKRWLLRRREVSSVKTSSLEAFDPEWYLAAYPDVAQAGIDPWEHYLRHGKAEGRLPKRNRALAWDHTLWRSAQAVMLPRLQALLQDAAASADEQCSARWALARWYAWQQEWGRVIACLLPDDDPHALIINKGLPGTALLAIEALCRLQLKGKPYSSSSTLLLALLKVLEEHSPDQSGH